MSARKKHSQTAAVVLTERALSDLREIERFSIKEWGRKTADKYLDAIAAALYRLKQDPAILSLEPGFAPGLFFYRVRKHFLVCDFDGQLISVLTILHTSMDLPTRLAELEPQLIAEAQFLHDKLRKRSKSD
ncbi:MAG: type II toxin-antitoxin system RelE/ParE family toxin [Pirellulales bacterium]